MSILLAGSCTVLATTKFDHLALIRAVLFLSYFSFFSSQLDTETALIFVDISELRNVFVLSFSFRYPPPFVLGILALPAILIIIISELKNKLDALSYQ